MRAALQISGLVLTVLVAIPCVGAELDVPDTHPTIQEAIDAAADGDTVIVAPGEYSITETIIFSGKAITVESDAGPEETIIRSAPSGPRQCSVVAFRSGDNDVVFQGFTLSGGCAGGIYCTSESTPTIRNCIVQGNSSGGIRCANASPTVEDCVIIENTGSVGSGGGVIIENQSEPVFTNCEILRNSTSGSGGVGAGIYVNRFGSAVFTNCTIEENQAIDSQWTQDYGFGGGVACRGAGAVTLVNCTIAANAANKSGAGVDLLNGSATLINCFLIQNTVGGTEGGGVRCVGTSSVEMTNCTIAWNESFGVYSDFDASVTVTNSIIWANEKSFDDLADPKVSFSCVEGGTVGAGEGNIEANPLFIATGGRFPQDYRLEAASPCIDAGNSEAAPATDFDGNARPCGARADMGAYESGCADGGGGGKFVRGDANADGTFNLTDPIFALNFLFQGGGNPPPCMKAVDANDDGTTNLTDPVFLLNGLFSAGDPPAEPRECGTDPTEDELSCDAFPGCA